MCGNGCSDGMCGRCHAIMKIAIGGLVLLNIYVWPKWTANLNQWLAFAGVLLVIKGAFKLLVPVCPHCQAKDMPTRKGK